jgi:hypothetical protein
VAWERRGGGSYFYRSVRREGRVRKEYWGTGRLGELAAKMAELDRYAREAPRLEAEEQLALALDACPAEDQLCAFSEQVDRMVSDALTSAGLHRHKRGEWRRRRT